jgi:predicted ribonuclease YlaK
MPSIRKRRSRNPSYNAENYSKCNKFDTRNESDDNARTLGLSGRITKHDIFDLPPANARQSEFLELYHSDVPLIVQSGFPGTGKTTIALHTALTSLVRGECEKIIIVKPPVAIDSIGHLPGTIEEKGAPFEEVYQEQLKKMTQFNDPYQILKQRGQIEFRLSSFLRSLTFDDAVIIVDEYQNCDRESLRTILTRTGVNSRVILCGDGRQDDLMRMRRKSGFSYINQLLMNMQTRNYGVVNYRIDDCLRNEVIKDILQADLAIEE